MRCSLNLLGIYCSFEGSRPKARAVALAIAYKPPQQTCLYGSHMGYPYGIHMGSATGFGMGPIWVSPYVGCPDGSHMGPI